MKKNFKFLIVAIIATSLLFSCNNGKKESGKIKVEGLENANSFMQTNVPMLSEYTLDNGIKVVVKQQDTNRIFTLNIIYEGGVAIPNDGKEGIENITLASMLRGSKNYTFEDIKRISFENSSGMGSNGGIDSSSINLKTIDKYWEPMLDMFSDAILNPSFDEEQVKLVKLDVLKGIKEAQSDPMVVTSDKLHEHTFKGHPYASSVQGTEESVNAISIDDIKKWYDEKLSADRMMIVAVGNFDTAKLISQLNEKFGKIATKNVKVPEVAKLKIPSACYTYEFPASKGIAYIRGDYELPSYDTKDFTTLQFAYSILNELLFEVVRTQNAACYSVWSNPKWFKSTYGAFVVFKSDKPTLAKTSIDEAIAILASGKAINLKAQGIKTNEGTVTESNGPKYAPISENLEAYKAKFINSFYNAQVTNDAIASQIVSSQIYFDNSYEYLKLIDKINAITADDVVKVANEYLTNGKVSWMIVGDKDILSKVEKEKFMKFTGKVEK